MYMFFFFDASQKWKINFQDPASPIMEGIIRLHDDIFYFLVIILFLVLWFFFRYLFNFFFSYSYIEKYFNNLKNYEELGKLNKFVWFKVSYMMIYSSRFNEKNHGIILEFFWTVLPSMLLIKIAYPSFLLLYSMDESIYSEITLKVIGHQWYWSYEYSDYPSYSGNDINIKNKFDMYNRFFEIESYMLMEDELRFGWLRLLEVDNKIVLPVDTFIRVIVSAADVLHAWAIPSLGVKIDAVPGRLNQINLYINRQGVYYGQCSEICGVNHGFMPIVIRVVSKERYDSWSEIQAIFGWKGQSSRIFKLVKQQTLKYDIVRQTQINYLEEFDKKNEYYF